VSSAGHCGRHERYRCDYCERNHELDYHGDGSADPGKDAHRAIADLEAQLAAERGNEFSELCLELGSALENLQSRVGYDMDAREWWQDEQVAARAALAKYRAWKTTAQEVGP